MKIDTIVLHYTGMQSAEVALQRLCDEEAEVSSHYMINENGEVLELVEPEFKAWHAGVSRWRGKSNINENSVGIELVNPGHEFGYQPFPDVQIKSCIALCQQLMAKYPIEQRNVIAHSDIAPSRKEDPGELFPWGVLSREGVGLYPQGVTENETVLLERGQKGQLTIDLTNNFNNYGYQIDIKEEYDEEMQQFVVAFQRHFAPFKIDGKWNQSCQDALDSLLGMIA